MSQVSDGHALYQAAVGFMVASKSDADSWEHVARWVHLMHGAATGDEMEAEFKLIEKQIKADFNISVMPSAWRSAKATALKAESLGVLLVLDDKVVGKTDVAKSNKLASTPIKVDVHVSDEEFVCSLNGELINILVQWQKRPFKNVLFITNLKHILAKVEAHA